MGIDRLENKQLGLANTHNTTCNIEFGWVLTGQKQTAIACKYPQHNMQHRIRMGIDQLETNIDRLERNSRLRIPTTHMQHRIRIGIGQLETKSYLQITRTQHATQNSEWVLTRQKQTAISCKYLQHNMQHRIQMGFLAGQYPSEFYVACCVVGLCKKQLFVSSRSIPIRILCCMLCCGQLQEMGVLLTGQKQTAISCKDPQHNMQHRIRMGIDRLETNAHFLQLPTTQHATQNSDGY